MQQLPPDGPAFNLARVGLHFVWHTFGAAGPFGILPLGGERLRLVWHKFASNFVYYIGGDAYVKTYDAGRPANH